MGDIKLVPAFKINELAMYSKTFNICVNKTPKRLWKRRLTFAVLFYFNKNHFLRNHSFPTVNNICLLLLRN